jgi:AraC family transcriptional regulator of adaptative response / DNA-3-methyladenine glycosylase II
VHRHLPVAGDAVRLLAFLGLHAAGGVEAWDGRCLARVQRVPGGLAVVRLTATASGVDVEADLPDPGDEGPVLAAVGHLVGAGHDPRPAEDHLAADPVLGPLVASRPGLVAPGSAEHAETLLRTVIGQQVSLAGARAVTGRVVAAHGEPLGVPRAGLSAAFPSCEALAAADPATLPMPRARGRSVVAVAAALADDPTVLLDDERLLALPGVGPWTVAYTRLRTRRDPDVFLPTDLAVRRQLEAMGVAADARSAQQRADGWAPFRTTALMHLWAELLDRRAAA